MFGEAAGRLIATHPMNSELRELETILCPPNGTPRRTVEQVYGKPAKYDNIADFYFYDVSSRLSLCVLYHEEKVREGGFWHGKIRELEPSVNTVPGREIPSGPPLSYGDLLLDLQQKVDNLGDALATLQSKRVPIPWHPWRADAPNDPPHQ